MQVTTSSTLTLLHDGQFWVGICEHEENGSYSACRIVFGATEPADTEILAFVCRSWATLVFDIAADDALPCASSLLAHANPKRRQREAKKLVGQSGVGTKAQQAMSAGYEARKVERRADARIARQVEAERRFRLKQAKRKEKHKGR
ncbi:MAG: YjdF family protein [Gordonibacter sp.]|nr:YjdF family protein [Gordonibacter sp.]